jgi:P-type conjugative transfer protein TrbJ
MTRTLLAAAVAVAVVSAAPRARAQIPVTDYGNLTHNAITAANSIKTVLNEYQQIKLMQQQIQYQIQSLKSIDPKSIDGLIALLNQSNFTYGMIQGDLSTIGYNITAVNRSFSRLFPAKQQQWQFVHYGDFTNYYDNWHAEVVASSQAAVRAQSAISTLDANNRAIVTILSEANDPNTGQVKQLQLVNKQLGLIHTELVNLVQNLAMVGRVITDWTAASAGERMMDRERGRRFMEGYTNRGKPSRPVNHL